ncbi:MAG: STAS domain-containing protein [Actinomycetota bacterium]
MIITKTVIDNTVNISLEGRLDTITSGELSAELGTVFEEEFKNLVFDLLNLEYISSAGLRVFLTAQKKATAAGAEMKITGANESVKEVFNITGFSGIMTIE